MHTSKYFLRAVSEKSALTLVHKYDSVESLGETDIFSALRRPTDYGGTHDLADSWRCRSDAQSPSAFMPTLHLSFNVTGGH